MNSDSWSPAGRTFNRIPLPDPIPYAEVNIDLNWTADEHSRHDEERPPHDTSFRPSSNCVLQSSLNKPSGVRESKGAGRFGRAKVWLSEVRQYFLTLALVITAVLALKELAIERIGLPEWTLVFAFIPPLLVFLFRTIPRLIQTRHEQTFIKIAINSKVTGPTSYFLIRPYGEEERKRYARADGMHTAVLDWCRNTDESILILTGLSGTGKSSLLTAFVIPLLREGKPLSTVLLVRSFDNPLDELRKELLSPGIVWDDPPDGSGQSNLVELLREAIIRLRRGKNDTKIYVVFDQFEELFLLHKEDSPAASGIREFLTQLRQTELPGVVVILSVRSDLRIFLEKFAFPPLNRGKNWQDIPAFTFADSIRFIIAPESGLNIPPPRLNQILTEAAAVDGTLGLIRPIVLNMVGLVLPRIAESPRAGLAIRTLLANELRAHINQRERRRISRIILPEMLTYADIKNPKSIGELKTATGLEPQLILGFLQDLELAGYVRQISHAPNIVDRIFEISHDFVARLLGPIVRTRFETLRGKIFKVMYPALVAAWVLVLGALFIAAPWLRRQRAEEILRDRISMYLHDQGDGYLASEQSSNFTDLRGAVEELVNFGSITELNLTNCLQLTNVDGLKALTALQSLNLCGCYRLTNVDELKGLTALQSLNLSGCYRLTNLDGLKALTALKSLNLSYCYRLTNVDGLNALTALQSLNLSHCSGLTNRDGLKALTALQSLDLSFRSQLTNVDELKGLTALQSLNLSHCSQLTNVDGLKGLTALQSLNLGYCSRLTNVDALKGLTALRDLDVTRSSISPDEIAALKRALPSTNIRQ